MNIKKIIREEVQDLSWISETSPSIYDIIKYVLGNLNRYKLNTWIDEYGVNNIEILDSNGGLFFVIEVSPETTWEDVLSLAKSEYTHSLSIALDHDIIEEYKQLYLDLAKYKDIKESYKHLNRFIKNISLLNEVKDVISPSFEWDVISDDKPSPEYVWDFPQETKKELDLSKKWVKSKEDVIKYLKILINKIKNLPNPLKKKIIKYVLYSFIGILTVNQLSNIETQINTEFTPKQIKSELPAKPINKVKKIRSASEDLFNHLKYEEGSIREKGEPVLTFYDLGDGAYTVGYGHAVFSDPSRGSTGGDYEFVPKFNQITPNKTTITKKQAEQLLRDDIVKASKDVNEILDDWDKQGIKPKITQKMYDAMVSMVYNMGRTGFRKTEFIQSVKNSDFKKAKEDIKNTSSHMFRKYPGLKTRREVESKMFAS